MLFTVEGTYTEGKVELSEQPTGIKHAKVLVTFLTIEEKPELPCSMRYGQFAGISLSTEDDFRIAEWRGEVSKEKRKKW
jgi:hypothetical protein